MTFIWHLGWIVVCVIVLILGGFWNRARRRHAENWPDAQGVITSADWTPPSEGADVRLSQATLAYSYVVNGERYGGYAYRQFFEGDDAADYVLRVRDKKVLVKYKPNHPEQSMLWEVLG